MSKVDKLSILGVRSFDNTRSETIQFHAPLTLIVGLNGSGKTTIIECLKYVTTGDLPPNAKGGAFIHDPKLCGEKEVLAQVKVSFRSTEGTRMVCTRNLQLTVKKAQRSMKTLEGSVMMFRDGEKLTMSSRVAEMDTMMPRYLGVSKAILDSVIFCHQEESLWPLSEPAKLKQRFDEIFEALKYTKAIDNIKVLQKNQKTSLISFKKDEEYLKSEKDRGDKMEKQSRELHAEIDALRSQSDEKSAEIKEAAKNAEQAWQQAETAGMIVVELSGKRIEAKTMEESVQSLRKNLQEMSDSDEDLQNMLERYDERVQSLEGNLASFKSRYSELNQDIHGARERVIAKERECGSYEAQKENYERQLERREQLVKETARSHSIRGFDYEINDEQTQAFVDRISRMAKDQNAAFERARRETQEELGSVQRSLNQINEQKSILNQRKDSARQSITTNDRKISNTQSALDQIDVDEGRLAAMESNLGACNAKMQSAKKAEVTADWGSSIESDEADLRRLEDRKEALDSELIESTRNAGDSARLDFIQKETENRKTSLETMAGAHGGKIAAVVGEGWAPASLEEDYQRVLGRSSSQVSEAEKQRDGTIREKEQIEYKLSLCRDDLKKKQATLRAADKSIRHATGAEPIEYPEEVRKMEEERETMKTDEDSFKVINHFFDLCISDAKSKNRCRTCTRDMKSREIDVLIANVEQLRSKVTVDDQFKADLQELDDGLEAAKRVRPEFEEWERLKNKEIPALEDEEKKLSSKREQLDIQLEQHDATVSDRQTAQRDVESLSRTVQNITKYNSDISDFKKQAEELLAKQKSAGLSRGLEQIQQDLHKVNEEAREVKARLVRTTGDRDRNLAAVNNLELEIRDIQSKISTTQYQLKEKKSHEGQIEEYKALNIEQRENIKNFDEELQTLVPQLSQAQVRYDDIARRGADKDRELQTVLNKLNNSLNQLKMANQDITAYQEKGGAEQLARGRREVESLKGEVTRLEQDQAGIIRDVKELENQLRNHAETKRGIEDNQRYRRDLRRFNSVRKEIEELETNNAEEDKAYFEREGSRYQMERNKLAAEQATIIGSLKSKDAQLDKSLKDWETDYKDAAKKYKEAHIRVETTKACIEDLGRYGGALDKAIMKYHSIKMEEINRIIDELWRKTYQGTDVDTIMIRSESENVKTNKSYNYRVCMVKQDAEMDMRGRCSAGQKVLASIIIRLALAECFGTNCGLIALDEPTTNLDRDNIRALAESLAEIIRMRRSQPNFQLIVITHDEEFLRYMGCSDFADVYYRVGRNAKQKSQIERQSIAEVI